MDKGIVIGVIVGIIVGVVIGFFIFSEDEKEANKTPYGDDGLITNLETQEKVKEFVINYAFDYKDDPEYLRACRNVDGLIVSKEGNNWKVICKWVNDPVFGNKNSIQLTIKENGEVLDTIGLGGGSGCMREGQVCGGMISNVGTAVLCCEGLTCKLEFPSDEVGVCVKEVSCMNYPYDNNCVCPTNSIKTLKPCVPSEGKGCAAVMHYECVSQN